jgi:DNA polymerase III alpha subunit
MKNYGLNNEEIEILKKHLLSNYGISAEQEDIMEISLDERVSNFTIAEANTLRKAVAKKKHDVLIQAKKISQEGLRRPTSPSVCPQNPYAGFLSI